MLLHNKQAAAWLTCPLIEHEHTKLFSASVTTHNTTKPKPP
jgi:hypothetical protein